MSSHYWSLVEYYNSLINQVSSLYSYLSSCLNTVSQCKPLVNETRIDDEPIDKGMITSVESFLKQMQGVFNTLIAECQLNVATYTALYNAALEEEKKLSVEE